MDVCVHVTTRSLSYSNEGVLNILSQGGVEGVRDGQLAVIARTNAVLFDSMVDLCNQQGTCKFGFAGVSLEGGA